MKYMERDKLPVEIKNNELPNEVMDTGLTVEEVAKTVKYVFDLPYEITIPSIEVRHIKNY